MKKQSKFTNNMIYLPRLIYAIATAALIPLVSNSAPADTNAPISLDERVTTNSLAFTSDPTNNLIKVTTDSTNDVYATSISTNVLESTSKEEGGLIQSPVVYNYLMRLGITQFQKAVNPDSDESIVDSLPVQTVNHFSMSADLKYDFEAAEQDRFQYIGLKLIFPF